MKFKYAEQFNNIALPPQDLKQLAFCSSNKVAKVEEWVSNLRSTQVTQTGIHLYQAIPQILRLKTDPETRFQMLECLRQSIQYAIIGLAKQFLSHNLSTPEYAQKTAIIALALQKNLIDGYTICVKQCINQRKVKSNQLDLLCKSLHRALSGISSLMLRHYQIYTQVPKTIWPHTYALFATAEFYELSNKPVKDNLNEQQSASKILDAFVKVLMFASSRLNQVTQHDVSAVFKALDHWVRFIPLKKELSENLENRFLVNQTEGLAPCQRSRFQGSEHDDILELDCTNVIGQLSQLLNAPVDIAPSSQRVELPADFSLPLVQHIIDSWTHHPHRSGERKSTRHTADICIGLINCHTEISGGFSFEDFLREDESDDDEFDDFDGIESLLPGLRAENSPSSTTTQKRVYKVTVQNTSPEGYCLAWHGDEAAQIEAGEVIAIKEQNRRTWNLGVARWIRKIKDGSQIGVKLLSTQPQPYAANMRSDLGEQTQFMRAFYLPPLNDDDSTESLITASVPFKAQAQVKLKQDDREIAARLKESIIATSKITQFEFTIINNDSDNEDL